MTSEHDATVRYSGTLSPLAVAGTELMNAREHQALTVENVAEALLLSTRQVRGLESGDVRPFHNGVFYRRALDKYTELLGISLPLAELLPRDPDESGLDGVEPLRLTLADCEPEHAAISRRPAGRWLAAAIVAGILLLLVSYALTRA